MTVEEIEIQVTASVEEALKEFKKMLPALKEQVKQMQSNINSIDMKQVASKTQSAMSVVKQKIGEIKGTNVDKTLQKQFERASTSVMNYRQQLEQTKEQLRQVYAQMDAKQENTWKQYTPEGVALGNKGIEPTVNQALSKDKEYQSLINQETKLNQKVQELNQKLQQAKENYKSIGAEIEQTQKNIADVSKMKINGIDLGDVSDDLSNIDKSIKEIGTEAEKSRTKVEKLSNIKFVDYSKIQSKDLLQPQMTMPSQSTEVAPNQHTISMWDVLRDKIVQVKPYVEQFKNALRGSSSSKELELLNYKISELEEKLSGGVNGEVHLSTKEIVQAEAELERLNNKKTQLENSSGGSNVFAGMSSAIQKIIPKLNGMSGITIKIKNQIKQMSVGMKQGLGHILKYAGALFSLRSIYSTLNSASSGWLSTQNAGAQQLSTNIDYMKNALGSALAPVIQFVTNLMYKLLKVVQSVVYALFRVNIFANASAKSYSSMAGSAKKAKKETKDLAGIHDEINNVQKNDDEDTGGGGGGAGAPSFDLSTLNPSGAIMEAIASGDWYGVGALLAEKLNQAMASIDWGAIQEKAILIATNIGNFINGAVDNLDWNLLGYTIGQGINTIFMFANTLLTKINFENIGVAIGETLKTGIATIQWDVIGQTLANGLNAIINIAYGFVTTFPWIDFGVAIGTAVNNFFGNIEWETAGQTVSEGIKGVFNSINTALAEVNWQAIGEDVATFLSNIDWVGILESVGQTISGAVGASIDIVSGLLGVDSESIITALTIAFGSLTTAIGLYNIGLIAMNIAEGKSAIQKAAHAIATGAQTVAIGLYNIAMAAATVATWLFNTALVVLTSPITLVVVAIIALIAIIVLCVKHWDEIKQKVSEVWDNIKKKISEVVDNIKMTISNWIDNVKQKISNGLDNIKKTWETIWEGLKTKVTDIWDGIWRNNKKYNQFNSFRN